MADRWYDKALTAFARGEIVWKASGGDTIRAFLVDSASYTPDTAVHQFLSDITSGARKGNLGGNTRADAPQLTLLDPAAGVVDANDIVFTAIPAGSALEYLVVFKDGGSDAASPLLLLLDSSAGLPVTPNGVDINVTWSNGANKIAKL